MRIFAISDLHVDYKENMVWVRQLSDVDFLDDVLVLAGDVSDRQDRMAEVLACLKQKYARVFFVPGNHDLWVRPKEQSDSLRKFQALMALCDELEIDTSPQDLGNVQIVPLLSWYEKPEESADSLYWVKEGEDPLLRLWSDNRLICWPESEDPIAHYMLSKNGVNENYDKPVISFSHFLPRQDLIFGSASKPAVSRPLRKDPHPKFNFSRVAGTAALDRQIRKLGSGLHIYGHQHRNRCRVVDGITYISHCLGYARERKWGLVCGLDEGPRLIWQG